MIQYLLYLYDLQNWGKVGGKAMLLGAANKAQAEPAQEEQK